MVEIPVQASQSQWVRKVSKPPQNTTCNEIYPVLCYGNLTINMSKYIKGSFTTHFKIVSRSEYGSETAF